MSNVQHADLATGVIHIPYNWTYADATARTGAGGFISGDIGKFARQLDNNSIWMLTATTPTWIGVGGSGGGNTVTTGALASLPAASTAGNVYMPTDDDFVFVDTASDWQIFHHGQYIGLQSARPVVASFTHTLTAGGGSAADSKAGLKLTQAAHGTTDSYDLWTVALPSTTGPWTATMYQRPDKYSPKNYQMAMMALLTASGGSSMDMFGLATMNGATISSVSQYQSSSTAVTAITLDLVNSYFNGLWVRVQDDGAASGTSRTWSTGRTLAGLVAITSVSHTLTITPAKVGILLNARNTATPNMPIAITVPYWTVTNP